jgi:dihydrofolate reductase
MMRKLVAGLAMSLDGVVESPEKWGFQYFNDEVYEAIRAGVAQADAVLLGRRTYLEFAELWPTQGSEVPMAEFLNTAPKYVVSATLDTLPWGPASLLSGDLAEELTRLKRQPGRDILIPGSPMLVRSLLHQGLLDELALSICPIVVGAGLRLFDEATSHLPLQLVASRTYRTGVLGVGYRPAGADPAAGQAPAIGLPGPS